MQPHPQTLTISRSQIQPHTLTFTTTVTLDTTMTFIHNLTLTQISTFTHISTLTQIWPWPRFRPLSRIWPWPRFRHRPVFWHWPRFQPWLRFRHLIQISTLTQNSAFTQKFDLTPDFNLGPDFADKGFIIKLCFYGLFLLMNTPLYLAVWPLYSVSEIESATKAWMENDSSIWWKVGKHNYFLGRTKRFYLIVLFLIKKCTSAYQHSSSAHADCFQSPQLMFTSPSIYQIHTHWRRFSFNWYSNALVTLITLLGQIDY